MAVSAGNNVTRRLTRTAARVYAVLDSFGDGSTDVIDRLIPFLEPILAARVGERLDPSQIATEVRSTYRWNFNEDIVEVFVPRLEQRGWLVANDESAAVNTYFIVQPNDFAAARLDGLSDSVLQQFEDIAADFKSFAEKLSPLTALPRSTEEFQDILIEWLLYVEAFSEHNLNFRTHAQQDSKGILRQVVDVPEITTLKDEEKFLCARYVQYAINNNPEIGAVLCRIASIGLLTEVVQDFVKPVNQINESDLVVYLDAPIAMELLGVSGRAARDNITPIVDELKRIGCQVRIYSQSLNEIKTTLAAVLKNARPTGQTAQAIARGDVLRPFVSEVAGDPEAFLAHVGVLTTHRKLDQNPGELAYFTNEQYKDLYAAITFQQNPNAREHDATVSAFIMRQRRGRSSRDLFNSGFVLLTKNGLLAQLMRRKCIELGVMTPSSVPPVVHRRVFATTIWLRTGLGASSLEIPKRLLLASCEQVLAIRPGVVNAVREITEQLGDEEKIRQLDLLVARDRSAQMLMDKTLGAASVPNASNIAELFNEMLHPYLEEQKIQHADALKAEKQKARVRGAKDREKIKEEADARRALAEELLRRKNEDLQALNSLCRDVYIILKKRQHRKKIIASLFAVILAFITVWPLPDYVELKWPYRLIGLVATIVMGYLTITGSGLLSLDINKIKALEELSRQAQKRSLAKKLERFNAVWEDNSFHLIEVDTEERTVLL